MQIRKTMRRQLAVAGVMAAMLIGARAQAQVLDQVPSNSLAVLKIKNLDAVSRKAAKMAKGLGLDQVSPEFGDPLGALEDKAHMGKGVDKNGDLAVVFEDPDKFGGEDKSILILVPITDYKAFLGNFKTTKSVGDLTKATPVEGDEDVYVAEWGKYAAMSPNKDIVSKKPDGLKLDGAIAREAATKDAFVYANVVALKVKALPELKKAREEMMAQFDKGFGDAAGGDAFKQFAPVINVAMTEYFDAVEEVLNDSRGAMLGVNLSDAGISTTILSDFAPDSAVGKLAHEIKNTDKPLLAGLPDKKYFAFGGSVNNPEASAKLLSNMLDPIKAELAKIEKAKKFIPAIDSMQKSAASTTGVAVGWVAPAGPLGGESVLQQVEVIRGDAPAIHASQREVMKSMGEMFKSIPQQKDGPSVKFELKPDAKTVDGVKLDTYETKTELSDDNPQAAQVKQIMGMVFGPNGQTGVIGEVGAKELLFVSGGSDKLIADAVAAAKADTDTVSKQAGVKAVAGELPKSRAMEMYVDLDTILNTAIGYAKGLGLPVNVKLQPDLPPIGISAGSEGSAIRMDVFIPNTLIQGIVAASMQAQQQIKNGAGGGL